MLKVNLGSCEKNLSERKEQWNEVLSEVFGTINDSTYDLFLYNQKSNGVNRSKK